MPNRKTPAMNTQPAQPPAKLTRTEIAYLHLAAFQAGDKVRVGGNNAPQITGTVTTPLRCNPGSAGISLAALTVTSDDGTTEIKVTTSTLRSGQHTITPQPGESPLRDACTTISDGLRMLGFTSTALRIDDAAGTPRLRPLLTAARHCFQQSANAGRLSVSAAALLAADVHTAENLLNSAALKAAA